MNEFPCIVRDQEFDALAFPVRHRKISHWSED
jgi:hypothetical protein